MANNNKETAETWNKIASLYEEKFMDLNLYNESYDFICKSILKNKAQVLEIGCGPGNITKYILSKRPDFNVYGIDVAENMIELAKRNNPTASFKVMDSRKIGKLKTKYDAIICGFCLPYLSQTDSEKLVFDCHSLLTKNGLIYISFVEGDASQSGFQVGSSGDRMYFYYHPLAQLEKKLLDSGFEMLQLFHVPYVKGDGTDEIHTILIAKKF